MMRHDYARVEQAIHYLDQSFPRKPSLEELAHHVHLSRYHFQRVFRRWAGISPKRLLQYLSLEEAKRALAASPNILEAADAAGLSGPGRLHDLLASFEAVTPGEFKAQGAGLEIAWGFHSSPFGECLMAVTARGISDLMFVQNSGRREALRALRVRWPKASLRHDPQRTQSYAEKIFSRSPRTRPRELPLLLKGTNFQIKVWEALLRIPPGAVTTYEKVAVVAGRPGAARAAARAVAVNPIAFLIPCHRVIRKIGLPGGYRWGATRKRAMLAWERARFGPAA